ncbi:hypothetical protein LK533_02890 [Sphingomonas sp. PL-96]|uniref:hypothetical protein n=1 Tax=Sphingomonas sp. PL-96 TaxID=2887201 RepID=UPI001E602AB0|nr:hypothetical protein [Sphingomonas sp. PL-96]MCC2975620.1 hypothetical protein [Sphingomonas sp. PL-96]
MSSEPTPEPDECGHVIYVGQDEAGHWLVQDSGKKLEGRFVSRTAAFHFAEAERQIYHARLEVAAAPLVPLVSFTPVAPLHVLSSAA